VAPLRFGLREVGVDAWQVHHDTGRRHAGR
jgi:hypothetical protein